MKAILKTISAVLVTAMLFSLVSVIATAEEQPYFPMPTATIENVEIVKEIVSLRTETQKTFLTADGSYITASYEMPVHFEDANGEWEDIDNTLTSSGNEYVNGDSNIAVSVAKQLNEGATITVDANGYEISWGFVDANTSNASVVDVTSQSEGNEAFLNLESIISKTVYNNIYTNVDAEYIITPAGVKENIVLESADAKSSFNVKYNFNGLTASAISSNEIELKNTDGDVVYTISAPIMTDSDGDISENITLSIVSQSSTELVICLAADSNWLSDAEYPVVIDPSVEITEDEDLTFYSVNSVTGLNNSAMAGRYTANGVEQDNVVIAYTGQSMQLPYSSYVTDARLYIPYSSSGANLEIYSVNEIITDDFTWSDYQSTKANYAIDYFNCYNSTLSGTVEFNITSAVQDFQNDGYLTLGIESPNGGIFYATGCSTLPSITVQYLQKTGINDNYSYHTYDVDKAGTVYLNDATQMVTASRNDMALSTASISLIYTPKYAVAGATQQYIWRNIYEQTVTNIGTTEDPEYVWQNGNGEIIIFSRQRTSKGQTYYIDNNGFNYKYFSADNKIVSEYEDVYIFTDEDSDGTSQLRYVTTVSNLEQEDTASRYDITINYNSSEKISSIIDSEYQYIFNYNKSTTAINAYSIDDTACETSVDSVVYNYSGNNLTSATYKGETSTYSYDNTEMMCCLTSPSGYSLEFTYDLYRRVTRIEESAKDGQETVYGNYITVEYAPAKTIYTDAIGHKEIYVFDNNGNVTTVMNENGLAINQKTSQSGTFLGSTDITVPVNNLLSNSSFEDGLDGWSQISAVADTTKAFVGAYSAKTTNDAYVYKNNISVTPSSTYTLSAYVYNANIGDEGYTQLSVEYTTNGNYTEKYSSKLYGNSEEWQRLILTVDIPSDVTRISANILVESSVTDGTAYIDAVQLENHKAAYDYNLLENNDFTNFSGWYSSNATIVTDNEAKGELDNSVVQFVCSDNITNTISQTVTVNGSKDQEYTVYAWIKALGLVEDELGSTVNRFARVVVYGINNDTVVNTLLDTPINIFAQGGWYKLAESFALDGYYEELKLDIICNDQKGKLLLDGVELHLGGYAAKDTEADYLVTETTETAADGSTIYVITTKDKADDYSVVSIVKTDSNNNEIYRDENNVLTETVYATDGSYTTTSTDKTTEAEISYSQYDTQGREIYCRADGEVTVTTYAADGSSTTLTTNQTTSEETYYSTSDSDGNVTYTRNNGIENTYTYNDTGETTSEATKIGTLKMKTFTSYLEDENGNTLVTSTDSIGNITSVLTDSVTENVLETTDGNENITKYTYDSLNNLIALLDDTTDTKVAYTYENGNIKTITTNANTSNNVVYTFEYEPFGNIKSIKVGNVALVTYTYSNTTHAPLTCTYANGNVITYNYNSYSSLENVECGTTLDEDYYYDEIGNVYKTVDNINNTVTRFSGTQTQVWNAAETTLLHCYDSTDTVLEESINGTHYKTTYSDADATETEQAKTVVTFGNKTQTTYTDGFGRTSSIVTKVGDTVVMTQQYNYSSRTVDGEALTSEQISSIVTTVGTTTTTESYSYDANGNIRTISKNGVKVYEYIYNSLNELTCEYDYTNGKKIQYSYDALGNIRAAVTYNVTFGTNGTETAEYSNVVTYGYDDTNWADKATSFKGDSITYDASGNPTLLDGYTLSWKNGRQLASASKDGMTSSYSYDSSGIRTSKLVSDSVNYSNERKDYTTIDGRITSETVSGGGMGIESYDYTVYYVYNESCEVIGFKYKYLDYANYPNWVTENYSYVKNLQGDIVGIINDATGEQVVSYTYDAWGNITSTTGTLASTIGQYNSMRYRGYYYDTETGMYYLQSRYYNPEMRRFINADDPELLQFLSSSSVMGGNIFAYCINEPVGNVDFCGYASYQNTLVQKSKTKWKVTSVIKILWKKLSYAYTIENGIVHFSFDDNNYWSVLWRGAAKTLAEAIYKAAKFIGKNYLSGRTIGGIHAELLLHWALYTVGIKPKSTKQADMGAMWGSGYDNNAWAFEAVNIVKHITKININGLWGCISLLRDLARYV